MVEAILGALLALPGLPRRGETELAWHARAEVIAQAIDSATLRATCTGAYQESDGCRPVWRRERSQLAAILIVQGYFESRFAAHVQAGQCRRNECDAVRLPDGRVFHRARSYWQLHASPLVPWPEWRALAGVELIPTTDAAYAAARVIGYGYSRCDSIDGAIAIFATGRSCRWSRVSRRAWMIRNVALELKSFS